MTIIESVFISFLFSAIFIPIVISACKKFGWYDSTNERKIHTGKIPRLGAVGFVPAAIIGGVFFCVNYPEARLYRNESKKKVGSANRCNSFSSFERKDI